MRDEFLLWAAMVIAVVLTFIFGHVPLLPGLIIMVCAWTGGFNGFARRVLTWVRSVVRGTA